jgi:hypothetical protein
MLGIDTPLITRTYFIYQPGECKLSKHCAKYMLIFGLLLLGFIVNYCFVSFGLGDKSYFL